MRRTGRRSILDWSNMIQSKRLSTSTSSLSVSIRGPFIFWSSSGFVLLYFPISLSTLPHDRFAVEYTLLQPAHPGVAGWRKSGKLCRTVLLCNRKNIVRSERQPHSATAARNHAPPQSKKNTVAMRFVDVNVRASSSEMPVG